MKTCPLLPRPLNTRLQQLCGKSSLCLHQRLIGNFLCFLSLGNTSSLRHSAPSVATTGAGAHNAPTSPLKAVPHCALQRDLPVLLQRHRFGLCVLWCVLLCCWFIRVCVSYSGSHAVGLNESSVWAALTSYLSGIYRTLCGLGRRCKGNTL